MLSKIQKVGLYNTSNFHKGFFPVRLFKRGYDNPCLNGGMNKPYLAALGFHNQPHVVYTIAAAGFEKDQIAFLYVLKGNQNALFSHIP